MSSTAKKNSTTLLTGKDLTADQQSAIDFLYERDESLLMVPVGFGKTIVSLTAACELQDGGELGRVLVVAPLRVCQQTWATEHQHWDYMNPVAVAVGDMDYRRAVIEDERNQVVVINFDVLPWFFQTYGKDHGFEGLIIDELTKLKGGGKQFRALRPRIKDFIWRVGMTGTLAEEGLDGLFYQVMAVDGGARLGKRKDSFLSSYFYPTDWERRNWAPQEGASERLSAVLSDLVFQAEYLESDGLPGLSVNYVDVVLPPAARAAYREMASEMYYEGVEAANAAVMTGKLQQVCSGFLYDDENGALDLHQAKMGFLSSYVDGGSQTVIVYQFLWELALLRSLFPGGLELRDPGALSAWNSGQLSQLFLHPASGGHGLNLQRTGCSKVLFVGPIWSRDKTDQVIGRVRRRGNPVDLVSVVVGVAVDTVEDMVMLPRLAGKGDTAGAFRAHLAAHKNPRV